MRRLHVALALVIAAGLGGALLWRGQATLSRPAPPEWSLDQGIDEAADYLARVNGADGRFEYRRFVDAREVSAKKYNVLRHAGSIYALADVETYVADDARRARLAATSARASAYLVERYVRPVEDKADLAAVWSEPAEEGVRAGTAKLGGAALAMIGLLGHDRVDAGRAHVAEAQALARFVLFCEEPSGEFHAKYIQGSGFATDFESLYYPGEAILALTMLYEADHDLRWLEGGVRGIARLVNVRRGVDAAALPPDHWLLIAIDRLLPFFHDVPAPPIGRDEILEHAIALARAMIAAQTELLATRSGTDLDGSFLPDGRTTPTATRLEGLLALEHALGDDARHAAVRADVRASIARGIAFLRRAQIRAEGPARGAIPKAILSKELDAGSGSDDDESSGPDEIRIDYVQHALSAMVRYARLCKADPAACAPTK